MTRLTAVLLTARRWSKEVEGLYSMLRVSWRAVEQLQESLPTSAGKSSRFVLRGRLRQCRLSGVRIAENSSVDGVRLLKVDSWRPIVARRSSLKAGAAPSVVVVVLLMLLWLSTLWSKQVSSHVERVGGWQAAHEIELPWL